LYEFCSDVGEKLSGIPQRFNQIRKSCIVNRCHRRGVIQYKFCLARGMERVDRHSLRARGVRREHVRSHVGRIVHQKPDPFVGGVEID
jgi:hypothetical protein